jgi:hypothetical protein
MKVERPQPREQRVEESGDSNGSGAYIRAIAHLKSKGVQARQGGGDSSDRHDSQIGVK